MVGCAAGACAAMVPGRGQGLRANLTLARSRRRQAPSWPAAALVADRIALSTVRRVAEPLRCRKVFLPQLQQATLNHLILGEVREADTLLSPRPIGLRRLGHCFLL